MKINKLNKKINDLQNENNYLNNNYNFEESKNGYIYIYESECYDKGNKIKCYKFGITNNMYNRHITYLTGRPTIKLLCYASIEIDKKQIESCIKSILKNHKIKNKVETIKFISLKELKNIISKCYELMFEHTLNCMLCNKKYKFKKLDIHKCNINFIDYNK